MCEYDVVARNFRYIKLISSAFIRDNFYVHYLAGKLTLYAQRDPEVLEDGCAYNDLIGLYAISTEACELEMNLTDKDLFVFVNLARYGITDEQWDKIHEQLF